MTRVRTSCLLYRAWGFSTRLLQWYGSVRQLLVWTCSLTLLRPQKRTQTTTAGFGERAPFMATRQCTERGERSSISAQEARKWLVGAACNIAVQNFCPIKHAFIVFSPGSLSEIGCPPEGIGRPTAPKFCPLFQSSGSVLRYDAGQRQNESKRKKRKDVAGTHHRLSAAMHVHPHPHLGVLLSALLAHAFRL